MSNLRGFDGEVSTNNSTTDTLSGGATFTGVGEDVSKFSSVSVSWTSDVASADGGLSMEFSTDNTNWDRQIPVTSASDSLQVNNGGVHRLSIIAQFFRIVYTNGSGAQSSFRLQTLFHSDNSLPLVSRIEQQLGLSTDCTLTRPVTNIDLDLARRNITGQRAFFFFGHNDGVGTSYEDIHPAGGNINWLTTAGVVGISSSDAADTSAGVGTRSVEIHGLSATGVDQDEVVILSGTTEVDTVKSYVRVNKLHSEVVGTYGGAHRGDITARVGSSGAKTGAVLSLMIGEEGSVDTSVQYGLGEASNGYWTVPLGKVLYITDVTVNVQIGTNKTVDIILYEREGILNISAPFDPRRIIWNNFGVEGNIREVFKSHIKIKGLTDLFFRAKAEAAGTRVDVKLHFYLLDANSEGA